MGKISILAVFRLRAIDPLVCNRPARRFAQDDGFVVEVGSIWVGCAKQGKIKKVTTSQDDDFVEGKNTGWASA
jgi:hypothetical protein